MTWDVAVVGAGPAGALAAYRLARRGARVALIDGSHPREKPCGGGVTGRALDLVAGMIDAGHLPARTIRSARFAIATSSPPRAAWATGDAGDEAVVPLADGALLVVSRRDVDGALVDAARRAGATLVLSRAADVVRRGSRFEIRTAAGTVTAPFVIGADGANSLVRRRMAAPFARAELSIATGFFAHGATSDEILVEFVDVPPGYIWSFPRASHLAIGICTQADAGYRADTLRAVAREWIASRGIAPGATLIPYSWPIPSLSADRFNALTASNEGWFLVGDAAGLVDPITREGIFFALLSAQWAADEICSGGGAAHVRYSERVQEVIGADLARAARYKAGFFRPRFTRLLIEALRRSGGVRSVMADLVSGAQGYRSLKSRLAGTFDVGLAARWLFG
jgi:geranylgeranyl reductase family protein